MYQQAELRTDVNVFKDVAYLEGAEADPDKHRLDLFLPQRPAHAVDSLPVMVFVHGGSLLSGDKDLEVIGLDFYRNIGRFYSARGVAVAVVNYRLQPEVGWVEQVEDVASATRWVKSHVAQYAGLPPNDDVRLFLAGHSAGAWLVSRVALDTTVRDRYGLSGVINGVVSISGSGFEMSDDRTWELYPKEDWWAERFAVPAPLDWHEEASVVPLVPTCRCSADAGDGSPLRFLMVYSNQDIPALARQNRLLAQALDAAGLEHRLVAVSSESHRRTLMAMSHPRKIVAREVLSFIHTSRLDLSAVRQERVLEDLSRF